MSPKRTKKIGVFALLVTFFVVFGGARKHRWAAFCQDATGVVYELDAKSLIERGEETSFLVRVSRNRERRLQRWVLNSTSNSVSVDGRPKETILRGSVAEQCLLFLKTKRVLERARS